MATKNATLDKISNHDTGTDDIVVEGWIGEFDEDPGNTFRMAFARYGYAENPTVYYDADPLVAVPCTLLTDQLYGFNRVVSVDI